MCLHITCAFMALFIEKLSLCREMLWSVNSFVLIYFSLRKHLWTFFGVNTELFQCAAELKSKVSVYLPWDLSIHVEPDIKKLSVVVPIPMAVIHSFELRYDWFCFSADWQNPAVLLLKWRCSEPSGLNC